MRAGNSPLCYNQRLMLRELFTWITTPCPPYVRRMEYLYQAIALRGRYLRRKKHWQSHLERAKSFITVSAERCHNRGRVVVLGSGLLLDVPLEKLAAEFREVVLVDIVHLPEVCRRVKAFPNVRLVQHDVTGVAEELFHAIRQGRQSLPEGRAFFPALEAETGLLISLNLISQLAAIPYDYVIKRIPGFDEDVLDAWCDRIRSAHVEALAAISCDVCVIADYAFVRRDAGGAIVEQGSTVGELRLPEGDELWEWTIAPPGEERGGLSKTLSVRAWRRWRTAV